MEFLLASITPVVIFIFLVFRRDHVKEPKRLLLLCFAGGCAAYFATSLFEKTGDIWIPKIDNPLLADSCQAFFYAAMPEELAKFSILYLIVWNRKNFDHFYSGIVYAVFVSMGLALIENINYVFSYGLSTSVIRAVLAVPGHGLYAVIMGYYFSKAKFYPVKYRFLLLSKSLLFPMLFHGIYDFALVYMNDIDQNLIIYLISFFSLVVITLWWVGIKDIKRMETI